MKEIEEIEKDIKNASSYQIKLSANDILMAYEKKKAEPKKTLFPKFNFVVAAFSCASVLALAIIVPNLINNNNQTTIVDPQKDVKWGTRSQTAFQLYTGLSLISDKNSPSLKLLRKASIDDLSFDKIVTTYNQSIDTLNVLFEGGIYKENVIEKGSYKGQYGQYQYKMIIDDYVFLNNMSFEDEEDEKETELKGEIINENGSNYLVELSKEHDLEDNEEEIEMTIFLDNDYKIEIEQEHEQNELEYNYSLYNSRENLIYQESISLENNKDKISVCDLFIIDKQQEFTFKNIHYEKTSLLCEYEMDEYQGELIVEHSNNYRLFIDKETQKTQKVKII